jgi:hypothetical protein
MNWPSITSKQRNHIAFVLLMAFFYLICSFIVWDINAAHWSIDLRIMYSTLGSLVSGFLVFFQHQIKLENERDMNK